MVRGDILPGEIFFTVKEKQRAQGMLFWGNQSLLQKIVVQKNHLTA